LHEACNPIPGPSNPWREILYPQLALNPRLVWVFPEAAVSGPTIWVGLRGWVKAFRAVGLEPGDRLVVGGPPGLGWVGAVLAGLWLEATLCLVPQGENVAAVGEELDARLILGPGGRTHWDRDGQPTLGGAPRTAQLPRSRETNFFCEPVEPVDSENGSPYRMPTCLRSCDRICLSWG
jgi:hypothetical protein